MSVAITTWLRQLFGCHKRRERPPRTNETLLSGTARDADVRDRGLEREDLDDYQQNTARLELRTTAHHRGATAENEEGSHSSLMGPASKLDMDDAPYDPYVDRAGGDGNQRTAALQSQIDETVGIMRENINKVASRGERLDALTAQTEPLGDDSFPDGEYDTWRTTIASEDPRGDIGRPVRIKR